MLGNIRNSNSPLKVGIAGMGAIGSAVASALDNGIDGYSLHAYSDLKASDQLSIPHYDFKELAQESDLIIEALPPKVVPELTKHVFMYNKPLILISSCALLLFPEIKEQKGFKDTPIIVPSGALSGLDGVSAMMQLGIKDARIATTKKPLGYDGAPYIIAQNIDLKSITEKTKLFSGNALEASAAFPANINVAATLSLAGKGPEATHVEIWADPDIAGNTHEIAVEGEFSKISSKIENTPDPNNPKSSMLAAASIISILKKLEQPIVVL